MSSCKGEISFNLSKNLYHLTNAHTITVTTALEEQRGRSNDGNEALFGRAWASPTLAGLQCKSRVYVCLCMAIQNLNWANRFQIAHMLKQIHVQWTNSTPMKARLRTMKDKGRLLHRQYLKSPTVVAFTSGKGHAHS